MPTLKLRKPARLDKLTNAFPYQLEAIDAVRDLPFAAIFFEQGLGKTKIAIDLVLDWLLDESVDSVIVVTKKGLVRNWLDEFAMHSHIRPRVLSADRAANHRAYFSPCRVYLANYEAIALEEERLALFAKQRRLAVILDESQKIKNPRSAITKAFFRLAPLFRKRLIMTGTPMANRPFDIWSQIYFLDAGKSLGGNFETFEARLNLPKGEYQDYIEALAELFPKIARFALRQTKEGSGLELPNKTYETEVAIWEPKQRAMYERVRSDLQIEITRNGIPSIDDSEPLLKRLLRLVQIASNPSVVDEAYMEIPGKVAALLALLERIRKEGEKSIVWTSFVGNCRYLRDHLSNLGAVQVNGRMSLDERDRNIRKFKQDADVSVLVATPAAAKEGLTLTVANHVIFYDRSFSLDDYTQAQDRIHRISQTKTCYVHNLVLPDSIDEWVGALISLKSASAKYGMGDGQEEELRGALQVDINHILDSVLGGDHNNVEQ